MEANLHCLNHFDAIEGLRYCARCGRIFCSDCLVSLHGQPFCGACKGEQALDIQSGIAVAQMPYAHGGRRFLAAIVDAIVIGIPMQVFSGVIQASMIFFKSAALQFLTMGIVLLIWMVGTIAYEAIMLLKRNGQTVGKMALQIRVVRVDGSPLSSRDAWMRAVVRFFTKLLCYADYVPILFTAERTAIHDMAAGTRVVNI